MFCVSVCICACALCVRVCISTALTADDNYMDLAALVARNSLCNGGHMGCVLVKVIYIT
jgi:deoxycytidylate deaminase